MSDEENYIKPKETTEDKINTADKKENMYHTEDKITAAIEVAISALVRLIPLILGIISLALLIVFGS